MTLFINACVRNSSRTLELAESLLEKIDDNMEEINLYKTTLLPLDADSIKKRENAGCTRIFSDPCFDLAKQFATADTIIIAAPYWDLMFPSVLKIYLENISVAGITFSYSEKGVPLGLCKATHLYYVTTAGGFIGEYDFGFNYIKAMANNFFGIKNVKAFSAEGLDIYGNNVDDLMKSAKSKIQL